MRRSLAVVAFAALSTVGRDGSAQNRSPGVDVATFAPSPSPRALLTLELPSISNHLSFTGGLWVDFAGRVLTVREGDARRPLVRDALSFEAHAALGLFEYLEVGVAMPLRYQSSPTTAGLRDPALDAAASAGDLRAYVKVPILRGATGLAATLGVSFPTGNDRRFAGSAYWSLRPGLALARAFGPVTLVANLGLRLGERATVGTLEVNDELSVGVGALWAATTRVGVIVESDTRIGLSASGGRSVSAPWELRGAARFEVAQGWQLFAGVGRGLTDGYGAPDIRGLIGLRVNSTRTPCTTGPEDHDGFQDGDFCADPDNDRDGVLDVDDRCPNDAEDRDGVLDDDGCADPDNDGDGILDDDDRCPTQPEDQDHFQNEDGCPEPDNDRDGITDVRDSCPDESEDRDDFQDDDGCPEPGPDATVVTRTDSRLLVNQRIFFDFDSDTIRGVSLPVLDEIANALRRNADISRLRVEGYTDDHGTEEYNLDLSFRRARAVVEYLSSRGIARERLEYQGYGRRNPVADNSGPEGQALNRRVEFTIVAQGAMEAPPTPAAQVEAAPARPERAHRRRHRRRR